MKFEFQELFSVEFSHNYFNHFEKLRDQSSPYNGFTVNPTVITGKYLLNNGLLFKKLNAGFLIGYNKQNAGKEISREDFLKASGCSILTFRIDLADYSFYNYTGFVQPDSNKDIFNGNLPGNLNDLIFHFWNYNLRDGKYRDQGRLQKGDFLGTDDCNNIRLAAEIKESERRKAVEEKRIINDDDLEKIILSASENNVNLDNIILLEDHYFSKPFGQISIKLHENLPVKNTVKIAALATYWQYVLRSSYLAQLENPAILSIDNSKQNVFEDFKLITLPDGQKAYKSFISKEPIQLSKTPQRKFKLVNYTDIEAPSYKEIIPVLPYPDINNFSKIDENEVTKAKGKVSIIFL